MPMLTRCTRPSSTRRSISNSAKSLSPRSSHASIRTRLGPGSSGTVNANSVNPLDAPLLEERRPADVKATPFWSPGRISRPLTENSVRVTCTSSNTWPATRTCSWVVGATLSGRATYTMGGVACTPATTGAASRGSRAARCRRSAASCSRFTARSCSPTRICASRSRKAASRASTSSRANTRRSFHSFSEAFHATSSSRR